MLNALRIFSIICSTFQFFPANSSKTETIYISTLYNIFWTWLKETKKTEKYWKLLKIIFSTNLSLDIIFFQSVSSSCQKSLVEQCIAKIWRTFLNFKFLKFARKIWDGTSLLHDEMRILYSDFGQFGEILDLFLGAPRVFWKKHHDNTPKRTMDKKSVLREISVLVVVSNRRQWQLHANEHEVVTLPFFSIEDIGENTRMYKYDAWSY